MMALRISAEITLQGTDAYGFALKQIGLTRRDLRVQSRARLGAGVSMRSRAAEVMGSARVLACFVN